jgi:hypothetical protein
MIKRLYAQRKKFNPVGTKKLSGIVFHISPEGVKHRDMLNNSFAPTLKDDTLSYWQYERNQYFYTCATLKNQNDGHIRQSAKNNLYCTIYQR